MRRTREFLSVVRRIDGIAIAGVLLLLYIAFLITAPRVFTGYRIYMSFFESVPPVLICALGLTFVITAGEIDLSFPAIVAFSGFVFAWTFKNVDSPLAPWIGAILALVAGGVIGYINGLLVARIGVPSIMATLATQFFWYGVTVLLAGGLSYNIGAVRETTLWAILVGKLFGVVPVQAFWALLLAIFLWFILNRHRFGESIMFIGDNANVARVMGVNVEATRTRLFVMNGVLAAFASLLLTLDLNVFFPTQGGGFLLPALASVFIGGTSIAGGLGSIMGTFFGAYIIGSLEAGVVATGISGYWVQLVEGVVMGGVVVLNVLTGEDRLSTIRSRMRHWGVITRSTAPAETLEEDDVAAK